MATAKKKGELDVAAALANWEALNEALRECSEDDAKAMLAAEKKGKRRLQYLLRIHARFNRQRGLRERSELLTVGG